MIEKKKRKMNKWSKSSLTIIQSTKLKIKISMTMHEMKLEELKSK
jgi:hypothetical protein